MNTECRLCGAGSGHVFNHLVLEKYDVSYFLCTGCGSLQTEEAYWLTEAYGFPGTHIDVGQAIRIVRLWVFLAKFLQDINFSTDMRSIDYGGSSGLLTRLMRDSGYDFYNFDPFETSKYADYFQIDQLDGEAATLVTAFEVLEHLPNPAKDLRAIFETGPEMIIFTTQFWENNGKDWDYLVPCCGQHIFFYSERGLADFARKFGYVLRRNRAFSILVKQGSRYEGLLNSARELTDLEVGHLVQSIYWGTAATHKDGAYARERFIRELSVPTANRL